MNKSELIDEVAERTSISKKDARTVIESLFEPQGGVIATQLQKGDKVAIPGFGTFEARGRAARVGRNPRTGAETKIAASTVPAFKAGKSLKEALPKPR